MQSTFYFQFIHLLFFQISKFTTFKPIKKTELMQFFWTAVKLIIPLSSCVFFKEKMLYITLYFFQKDIWLEKTISDNPRKILISEHQQM